MEKKYPEGYFVSMYIAVFMPLGLVWGMIIGKGFFGAGIAIGLVLGYTIGLGVEKNYKEKGLIRHLTKREKRNQKLALVIGAAVGILFVLFFILTIFFG